jgi:hypothetical protein
MVHLQESGNYSPSFVTLGLEEAHSSLNMADINALQNVAAQAYLGKNNITWIFRTHWFVAGNDTSTSVLSTFFLVMILHSEIQKKAQQEIDQVIRGRLPEHSDLNDLPYLQAVIKEVYR